MKHILAAVDGSDPSKKAALFAVELARQTGAQLTLLYVLEPPMVIPLGPVDAFTVTTPAIAPVVLVKAKGALDEMGKELPPSQVDRIVEIGRTTETILEKATNVGADHIVVGARGHGLGKWLLGSVSDRVVHHASCPVTVVR